MYFQRIFGDSKFFVVSHATYTDNNALWYQRRRSRACGDARQWPFWDDNALSHPRTMSLLGSQAAGSIHKIHVDLLVWHSFPDYHTRRVNPAKTYSNSSLYHKFSNTMSRSQTLKTVTFALPPPVEMHQFSIIQKTPSILLSAYMRAVERAGAVDPPAYKDHDLRMQIVGVADWTPEDFNACAERYNLYPQVPEHALADGSVRREIFGWAGPVDMDRVRCQLYVHYPGDLSMAQQLARLQCLGRV